MKRKTKLNSQGICLCLFIGFYLSIISTVVISLLPAIKGNGDNVTINGTFFLASVILAPLMEELIFRKFVFQFLTRKLCHLNIIFSAFITSIIFAAVHSPIAVAVIAFIFSLLLCVIVDKTETIISSILIHFSFNLTSFLLVISDSTSGNGYTVVELVLTVVGLILLLSSVVICLNLEFNLKNTNSLDDFFNLFIKEKEESKISINPLLSYIISPFKREINDWKLLGGELKSICKKK